MHGQQNKKKSRFRVTEIIRQYLNFVKGIVFCIVRLPTVENFQIIWKEGEV